MPTHEEEFQPPSWPWASDGWVTVGMTQVPKQVDHWPCTEPPDQLLLVKPASVFLKALSWWDLPSWGLRKGTIRSLACQGREKTFSQAATTPGWSRLVGRRQSTPCLMRLAALALLG